MRAVEICEHYNLPFINFECPIDELPDLDKVEQILKGNRDIALVYTTYNETGTSILNLVREIGLLAHKYGAAFIVDTISAYAMRPIDIEKGNIDFCMASAQKGPDLPKPDESYHGISYTETYGKKAYIVKARMQLMWVHLLPLRFRLEQRRCICRLF